MSSEWLVYKWPDHVKRLPEPKDEQLLTSVVGDYPWTAITLGGRRKVADQEGAIVRQERRQAKALAHRKAAERLCFDQPCRMEEPRCAYAPPTPLALKELTESHLF